MTMLFPPGTADFSGCGRYRYRLTRDIGGLGGRTLTFIMLNPSTADGTADDPTIRRCKGFARDWSYRRLVIVNVYAFRSTDPHQMWRFHREGIDVVGEDNNSAIVRAVQDARISNGIVLCAWGKGVTNLTDKKVFAERVEKVTKLAGGELWCLDTNTDGSPKHPLYLPEYTEAEIWRGA